MDLKYTYIRSGHFMGYYNEQSTRRLNASKNACCSGSDR